MNNILISELSQEHLFLSREKAARDLEELISSPFLDGVIKGRGGGGWRGIVNIGLWPGSSGLEERYVIHLSLEGIGGNRNVEGEKIMGYLTARHVLELLPENSRSVYVPAVRGHKVVYEDSKRGVLSREFYVDHEPIDLTFSAIEITPENYTYFLGRDVARFMFCGMVNVSRHIRPNFRNNSFKTCMIDLDTGDPHTFYWVCADSIPTESLNYQISLEKELAFFENVLNHFLKALIPEQLRNSDAIKKLKSLYSRGFYEEVGRLKGYDAAPQFRLI